MTVSYNVPTKMSGRTLDNGSDDVHVNKHPHRNAVPTTKLLDKNNLERPALLPFQQKCINDYRAAHEAQGATTVTSDDERLTVSRATSSATSQILDATSSPPPTDRAKDKRKFSEVDISSDSDNASASRAEPTDRPLKKKGT